MAVDPIRSLRTWRPGGSTAIVAGLMVLCGWYGERQIGGVPGALVGALLVLVPFAMVWAALIATVLLLVPAFLLGAVVTVIDHLRGRCAR